MVLCPEWKSMETMVGAQEGRISARARMLQEWHGSEGAMGEAQAPELVPISQACEALLQ